MKLSLYAPTLISVILFSTACNGSKELKEDSSLIDLKQTINTLTKDKSCDSTDQCQSIAYGSKGCGGPHSYLIYSTKNTDSLKLSELVIQHNNLEKQNNIKNNVISNCMMVMPSELVCRARKCQNTGAFR